jgi:hypothetical protein
MLIRGMDLPLIISCILIIAALIIFPLIISYKSEKNKDLNKSEWEKIKDYENEINNRNKKNK